MRRAKKVLAALLSLTLVVTGLIIPGKQAAAAEEEKAEVIDVTAYGADPSGANDSAEAIQDAIAAAKELTDAGKAVVLNFPTGRYDIYPDRAVKKELYISNTTSNNNSEQSTHKVKTIGMLFEDMDNVTVEGNDSFFMFHGKMMMIATIDCKNVKFQNFTLDFQVPTVIDITVEKVEGNVATVYVPECYNYSVSGSTVTWMSDTSPYDGKTYWTSSNGMNYIQYYDTVAGLTQRNQDYNNYASPFSGSYSLKDLGNHRIQFTYTSLPSGMKEGLCYQMRTTVRDHAGAFFWKSKDVVLENMDVYFLHGFGMVGQSSENLTLRDVDFEAPKFTGRTTAGYADFIQMSGCKGKIDISECTFSNPHDDPINVHGTFLQVVNIDSSKNQITVRYMHHETSGFPSFFKGDTIEFVAKSTMLPLSQTAVVQDVNGPDGQGGLCTAPAAGGSGLKDIVLTLDKIPAGVTAGTYAVEDITYTPEVHIYNNIFKETPTRGILVTTRKPVVIENNVFDGIGMAGIYISSDANSWYESGLTKDVTIQNNVFTRGQNQAIFVDPTNTASAASAVHENLKILNNTFYMEPHARTNNCEVLDIKSVNGVTFKDNTIYRQDAEVNVTSALSGNPQGDVAAAAEGQATTLAVGDSRTITATATQSVQNKSLYAFIGCQNVDIEGNHYDGGLNARVNLNSTNANSVTIKDDSAKLSTDNMTNVGAPCFESSDEKVVTVSQNGVVEAVGKGTATVKTGWLVGGRKFDGQTYEFTVTDGQAKEYPTDVKITTGNESIKEKQSVTYQTEVTGSNNADKKVTWSVLDPKTGGSTECATIDETSGELTPLKSGAVEVVAKTVNGLEARRIVSIQLGGLELSDKVTIDETSTNATKDESLYSVDAGGKLHVKAAGGSQVGTYQNQKPVNVFTVPVEGDVTNVTVTLKIVGKTKSSWEDVGLYLYHDADNFVALQRKHRESYSVLGLVNEIGGDASNSGSEQLGNQNSDPAQDALYYKLVKQGNQVTAYYSTTDTQDNSWQQFGTSVTNDQLGTGLKVAFGAMGDANAAGEYDISDLTINGTAVSLTQSSTDALPTVSETSLEYKEADNTLTAKYTASADAIVKWEMSDTENGTYTVVAGKEGATITTTKEMQNKYVKAVLIPVKSTGVSGDLVRTEAKKVTGEGVEDGVKGVKSANALLKTVSVSGLADAFNAFSSTTYNYYTTADADEDEIGAAYEAQDPKASVIVILNDEVIQGEGIITTAETEGKLKLSGGRNLVEVVVIAQDGVTSKHYRFTVLREGEDNSELASLKIGGKTIDLTSGTKTSYTNSNTEKAGVYKFNLKEEKAEAVIEAQAKKPNSLVTVFVNGKLQTGSDTQAKFEKGDNEVVIMVTPETSDESTWYVLNVNVDDGAEVPDTYTVTVESKDDTMGTVKTDAADGKYEEGTEATVTATPKDGYEFVKWTDESGKEVSTENPYTFTVEKDVTLAAEFKAKEEEPPKVESVKFDSDKMDIIIGETEKLSVKVTPEGITDEITWSSSNKDVLAVDADGTIRALWPGQSVVKAEIGGKSAELTVTVYGTEKVYEDVFTDNWYYDACNWTYVNKIMTGLNATTFGPDNNLVRAQFAVILYRIAGSPEVDDTQTSFPDVEADKNNSWYKNAVIWANENKIITGYTNSGLFGPNDNITREQMATILFRYIAAQGIKVEEKDADLTGFPDAGQIQSFAKEAMNWAVAAELIKGDGGYLKPQGNANRAETATIIWRFSDAYPELKIEGQK